MPNYSTTDNGQLELGGSQNNNNTSSNNNINNKKSNKSKYKSTKTADTKQNINLHATIIPIEHNPIGQSNNGNNIVGNNTNNNDGENVPTKSTTFKHRLFGSKHHQAKQNNNNNNNDNNNNSNNKKVDYLLYDAPVWMKNSTISTTAAATANTTTTTTTSCLSRTDNNNNNMTAEHISMTNITQSAMRTNTPTDTTPTNTAVHNNNNKITASTSSQPIKNGITVNIPKIGNGCSGLSSPAQRLHPLVLDRRLSRDNMPRTSAITTTSTGATATKTHRPPSLDNATESDNKRTSVSHPNMSSKFVRTNSEKIRKHPIEHEDKPIRIIHDQSQPVNDLNFNRQRLLCSSRNDLPPVTMITVNAANRVSNSQPSSTTQPQHRSQSPELSRSLINGDEMHKHRTNYERIGSFKRVEKMHTSSRSSGLPPRPLRSPVPRSFNRSMSPTMRNTSTPMPTNNDKTFTRIDPVTGAVEQVTTRTRSYTDLDQNALITEIEENIKSDDSTEINVIKRKTKKFRSGGSFRDHGYVNSAQEFEESHEYRHPIITEAQPYRATSQTNIHRSPQVKTQWISESNLQNSSSTMKHPTMHSTYSAHKENQRRMEEQRRATEDWHASTKHMHDTRSIGSRAVLEEMETITLQPIGRGVHDLEPTTGSISRSYRANTPTANRTYGSGWDQHDAGPRPMNAMNYHRETHTPRSQSPHIGPHKFNSQYEATSVLGSEVRHRSVNMNSDSQYRTTTSVNGHGQYHSPFSGVDSFGGTSGIGDNVDGESGTMHHVLDTSKYWYLPGVSRPDVIAMLRDKPAGSFVIRNSNTYADSFGLALKISPNTPKMMSTKDDSPNDLVRHFLIGTVPMQDGRGNGVHLRGFSSDPTFPSLSAFVHYHMHKQGALPCLLRLPTRTTLNDQMNFGMDNTILSSLPGGGVAADMLYLGSVEVDRMDNLNAAVHAVSNILTQISTNPNGLAKQCEVLMKVIPQDGITFIDRNRRRVLNKYIKSNNIIWCGMDPENREYHESEVRNRGVYNLRIFVIIARKQRLWLHENVAYVFSELDPTQSAINLVRYINSVFFA